jgi:radical SAM superfamily enzyme YgiQ (UPF0313 family)
VRKGSITMAVEAARDDMRRSIRKKVTDGNLMDGVLEVYKAGWNRVKLYFMSGFPGERPEDIDAIWRLSNEVSDARRRINKGPAAVNASVGWLVPKPFTPLQWMAQPRLEYYKEVRERLISFAHRAGRRSKVMVHTHTPERSILEAVFARGDRRLGAVIEEAWRSGARFDGWEETFNYRTWVSAFDRCGVDPAFYAHRERSFAERLPWDHIGLHMSRGYLEKSYDDMFETIGVSKPASGSTALPMIS